MDDFFSCEADDDRWQDEDNFDSHRTSYFDLDDDCEDSNGLLNDKISKLCPDTSESQAQKTDTIDLKEEEIHKDGLFAYNQRKSNTIEINSRKNKNQYISTKLGDSKQTKDLCANYQTLTTCLLEDCQEEGDLAEADLQILKKFKNSQPNLQNFRNFFGVSEESTHLHSGQAIPLVWISKSSDNIRRSLLARLSSAETTKKILQNKKMGFINKINALKFIESLRQGCVCPEKFSRWKT